LLFIECACNNVKGEYSTIANVTTKVTKLMKQTKSTRRLLYFLYVSKLLFTKNN